MLEIYTLLNPKVANYNGTGGIPAITPEDVAACLGRIEIAGPGLLVRAMSGDATCYKPLTQVFGQHLAHLAMLKHWKTGPSFWAHFDGLRDCVLHYYILPDTCRRCRGHGHITQRDTQRVVCPVCEGAGHKDVRESDKARAAGIPWASWSDTWADRYVDARAILAGWEEQADRSTRRLWWRDV